ncbi:hypothetical protein F2Q68_00003351 [Brassica cretica]|uniref:RING-type domain-containing protein n=1 Tax=Brassica cretica TaxID=69181 RepID=A0A8S9JHP5_BRACR|nr:hypothetical protein F2Q68_00003351 [Brassica cretica]
MRCNACWRELEGRAISTTCGHLLCTEDANKILSNDGACPICEQVLSKRGDKAAVWRHNCTRGLTMPLLLRVTIGSATTEMTTGVEEGESGAAGLKTNSITTTSQA